MKKNELQIDPKPITNIDEIIFNVLWPFECVIFRRRHNVHLIKQIEPDVQLVADWMLYELILFNLI